MGTTFARCNKRLGLCEPVIRQTDYTVSADVRPRQLVLETPRASMPPAHLADLTVEERFGAVEALGEPKYRARQLARSYFAGRSLDDATDLSPQTKARVGTLLPELLRTAR
ncbi:MAG TPA: hypothetical protein VHE83_17280, partial [Mycobacteriales bacterium]|nr:hypothetical protein [Mycobacteriales bacterium]